MLSTREYLKYNPSLLSNIIYLLFIYHISYYIKNRYKNYNTCYIIDIIQYVKACKNYNQR